MNSISLPSIIAQNGAKVKPQLPKTSQLVGNGVHTNGHKLFLEREAKRLAQNARQSELVNAALDYASHRLYVIPLHEPIFDEHGICTGCSCEGNKRSESYRQWLEKMHNEGKYLHILFDPNFSCPAQSRGKHPHLTGWEEAASNDPDQIVAWWTKWPTANIGIAAGKSGLLDLDLDLYKETYNGNGLSPAEEQTLTNLSGGGGQHLIYKMPDGAHYGNKTGELPPGIDVRGCGGLFVAPPSMHHSGKLYTWEIGYSPSDIEPLPLPAVIDNALKGAKSKTPATPVRFGDKLPMPDLGKWNISQRIHTLIYNPKPQGERSEADYSICLSLTYAGASDDEILAVFAHYPCGIEGKFAEGGSDYLVRTIANARAYVADHPRETTTVETYLIEEAPHDEGSAQCVLKRYSGKFRQNAGMGWLWYTGTHWERDGAEEHLDRAITETLIARSKAALDSGYYLNNPKFIQAVTPNASRVGAVKRQYHSLVYMSDKVFDDNPDLLNCSNGVIDLRTGALQTHSPEQYFTYCINTAYNPGASSEFWTTWLKGEVGAELTDWLQLAVGYSLTGHTPEEVMFYLFGPSRGGKGTFTESILTLLGKPLSREVGFNTFTMNRDQDAQNFDLAPLKPCRFIAASESKSYERFNDAMIKRVTGGNDITCAFKGKTHFTYRPQFKIWLSSNNSINADPEDDAVWGRIRAVEFPHSYLGREDKSLKSRMKSPEVQEGILAWAVAGAMRWYALGVKGIPEPITSVRLKGEQRAELDTIQMWLDEKCAIRQDAFISNSQLYTSYESWCALTGAEPKKQRTFTQSLKRRGFISKPREIQGKQFRGFWGITLHREDKTL